MRSIGPSGGHGGRWGAMALVLAMVAGFCGLGIEAAAEAHGVVKSDRLDPPPEAAFETPAKASAPSPPEVVKLVWQGADIDGDGQPDFANPTGQGVRGCDDYGCGAFGAERDAGGRRHEGVDFDAAAGQAVDAPMSGFVSRIGYAYPGDPHYRFIEIENPALRYVARVFYVDPKVREGQAVRVGQPIGEARSLQLRYRGITNHVHLEIERLGGRHLDPTRFLTQRMEQVPAGPSDLAQAAAPQPRG
jgi:murein DD-endopeptidase MepM/ murein hydrolase activator NlpD